MGPKTATTAALIVMAMGSAYALTDSHAASKTIVELPAVADTGGAPKNDTSPLVAREERTIYFRFNQSQLPQNDKLPSDAKQQLDDLAALLGYSGRVQGARIIGYADRIGDARYNEQLSRKRAESVKDYLVAKGVLNARVADTRWAGPASPTTECSDSSARSELIECLQQDRRVEIEVDYIPDLRASR